MFQAASLASGILLNPTVCATAIQDATNGVVVYTGATTNVAFLQQGATPLLAVNTKYSPRLLITAMQLVPTGIPATPVVIPVGSINPPPGTYSQWLVNLVISAAPTSGFVALPDKKMPLTIYTSPLSAPPNKISFCSIQSTATEACSALSMNFNAATQTCANHLIG